MNSNDKSTLRKFIAEISVLHIAMTFGTLAAILVIYYFSVPEGRFDFSFSGDFFMILCPIMAILGVYGGSFIYKNRVEKAKQIKDFEEKLLAYRAANIVKFALVEGPALICAIALLQTQNLLYLTIGLVLAIYLFTLRISRSRVVQELELD